MKPSKSKKLDLQTLTAQIAGCTLCPRLVEYRQQVAAVKRRAYAGETYWGRPVPGFGDPQAHLLLVGLAPGAHGANRTGRMFTGDRSGDFLFRALYETGFANQPNSTHRDDGLVLQDAFLSAAGRCAPPGNKPLPEELEACRPFLEREMALLPRLQAVVCLGKIGLEAYLRAKGLGPLRHYRFAHGAEFDVQPRIFCTYHPSQQNTQTGRLTQEMMQQVFRRVAEFLRV
jgi:uracil-DNA glycosylase